MSTNAEEPSHGHSPAAWTAVVIMLVAFAVGTVAFCAGVPLVVWICAAVVVLGLIVGVVMRRLGYGVGGDKVTGSGH